MTFDMITMYFTSNSLPSKTYNQHTGLGLRQPSLITMKTLPKYNFENRLKRKTNTWNIKPDDTTPQWTNKQKYSRSPVT